MLNPSRLYSFLDSKNGFAVHILDGQKLIQDLVLLHPMNGSAFAYFRDTVLGFIPMIAFLKPGDGLGIYVDSENPYFRLKIETNHAGHTRTLLLPEDFNKFPMKITGEARVTKQFPGNGAPYSSVIAFDEIEPRELTNQVIRVSYQVSAETVVSEASDQSLLLVKLPPARVDSLYEDKTPSLAQYLKDKRGFFHAIFDDHHNDVKEMVGAFEKGPFAYLSSRQVGLFCPCSQETMEHNLRMLYAQDPDGLFEGEASLETRCDYCKKTYVVKREDLEKLNPFS